MRPNPKIHVLNISIAVGCIGVVLVSGPSWIAMIDCVVIGALLTATPLIARYNKLVAKHNDALCKLNAAHEANAEIMRAYYAARAPRPYVNENKKQSEPPSDETPRIH